MSTTKKEAIKPSTIRPGLLVVIKSHVTGNVSYHKRDLGTKVERGGKEVAEWETTRTIEDAKEFKAAGQVRMKAIGLMYNVCARSSFGLLCPDDKAGKLADAVAKARKLADDFNAKAKVTRVSFNIIAGRVAQDDVEATRAINGEVRDLIDRMENGIKSLDVAAVRDAASKAKALAAIVAPESNERLAAAIDAARAAATKIVKAGEAAAKEVDAEVIKTLKASRTAFLDIDHDNIEVKPAPAQGRAIDLG
jgi:hypothetical protein